MSTRRVVVIRHARAEREPAAADVDRPLSPRGQRDASAVGRWLLASGLRPDRVVVSPARRTRQTWLLAAAALGGEEIDVDIEAQMYDATTDDLLAVVRATPPDVGICALVGHSPSVHDVTLRLDDGRAPDPASVAARKELTTHYPTSGIAVFGLTTGWADVRAGTATLQSFTVPRG